MHHNPTLRDAELEALLRVERPTITERVPQLAAPAPVIPTAAALVTLGYCVAFSLATHLPAMAFGLADVLGLGWTPRAIPVPLAVLGGLLLGLGLATQVLHAQLARPAGNGARVPGVGGRFVYTGDARRRMMHGLMTAYLTAGTLGVALLSTTHASRDMLALLAY
jgi:hypothetical protein